MPSGGFNVHGQQAARLASADSAPVLTPSSDWTREPDATNFRGRRADRFWRDVRRRRLLAVADVLAAVVATAIVAPSSIGLLWGLLFVPGWVVIAKLLGLYDRDQGAIRHLTIDELPSIAAWAVAGVAGLGVVLALSPAHSITVARALVVSLVVMVIAAFLRGGARWLWRRTTPKERTAIIGEGDLARAARRKLELFPDMHLELVPEASREPPRINGGGPGPLRDIVHGLDRVIFASERIDPELIGRLVGVCHTEQVKLSVVSPLRGRAGAAPQLSEVADLPMLEYDTRDVSRSTLMIKRAFDVIVSFGALAVLAPLYPFVALAIKLDSRGPVIFSQRRAGKGGVPFRMYKLRTMYADAEDNLSEVVSISTLEEPMFKLRRDPRVTRLGRFLRRFSLDELPQLVNVLRGDMSIVGPRPEQIELVERYRPEHRFRLDVKPGMTGPMQISGRGELSFSERLDVELDYVENVSMARDLRILLETIPSTLRGTGAW
jgi:exopolysaccharide biosynthesis polyprenyl glycosylphosphotransferase